MCLDAKESAYEWRWCWKCLRKHLRIQCPACHKRSCVGHDVLEVDDDFGFPHYGYPVCRFCGKSNENFKKLTEIERYVPEYMSEGETYMARKRR